ncbi:MAG: hypothetical protein EOP19_07260 [Hyphomicrobiales bacterium]|nr:MAG: hypothetical protein EOP19_07260 [Hyphomicrobiales bacterium]
MGYREIPIETPLSAYEPPELQVECVRCKRNATLAVQTLRKRFGNNVTIGDLTRQVALSGRVPCGLAGTGQCSARAYEPPVWHWADLQRAWSGGWFARLHCRRNRAGLKPAKPCPEVVIVDVETLVATLGYDFKLEHLASKMQCPRCHSHLVDVEWIVPDPSPPPFAPTSDVVPLRLKPTPAQKALRTLKVVDGGRG